MGEFFALACGLAWAFAVICFEYLIHAGVHLRRAITGRGMT